MCWWTQILSLGKKSEIQHINFIDLLGYISLLDNWIPNISPNSDHLQSFLSY